MNICPNKDNYLVWGPIGISFNVSRIMLMMYFNGYNVNFHYFEAFVSLSLSYYLWYSSGTICKPLDNTLWRVVQPYPPPQHVYFAWTIKFTTFPIQFMCNHYEHACCISSFLDAVIVYNLLRTRIELHTSLQLSMLE